MAETNEIQPTPGEVWAHFGFYQRKRLHSRWQKCCATLQLNAASTQSFCSWFSARATKMMLPVLQFIGEDLRSLCVEANEAFCSVTEVTVVNWATAPFWWKELFILDCVNNGGHTVMAPTVTVLCDFVLHDSPIYPARRVMKLTFLLYLEMI